VIDVGAGFAIIATVALVGFLLARSGVVDDSTRTSLARLAFSVFTPCLLFTVLATADVRMLFSTMLVGTAVAATTACLAYAVVALLLWRRSVSESVIGSLAAGYVNGNNMGLPVATYVLGDPALVAPVMLFQIILLMPIALSVLELQQRPGTLSWRLVLRPLLNPLIVASAAGVVVSVLELQVAGLVLEPFRLIGAAAVPAVLLAFGISLHGQRFFAAGTGRRQIALVAFLKLFAMPAVAWGFSSFVLGLEAHALYAVVVLAALPTAQNVYTFAQRYGHGETIARDSTLVTTVGAFPVLLVVAAVLAPTAI